MLSRAVITPIIHVEDIDRARHFYGDVLGLQEEGETEVGHVAFVAGEGTHLELMVRPEAISTDATVLTFEVADVVQEVKDLTARGCRFETVDLPGAVKEGVVSIFGNERAAWFKDSEGNWLCVHQRMGQA